MVGSTGKKVLKFTYGISKTNQGWLKLKNKIAIINEHWQIKSLWKFGCLCKLFLLDFDYTLIKIKSILSKNIFSTNVLLLLNCVAIM